LDDLAEIRPSSPRRQSLLKKMLQALEQIAIRDLKMGDKMKGRETCNSGLLINGLFK
jgi:hypothetical protein